MNPLLAIALLGWVRKNEMFGPSDTHSTPPRSHRTTRRRAKVPSVPRMPPAPHMPPEPTHTTHTHASPADHAASEHVVHPAAPHASPAERAAHELPESTHHTVPKPEQHVTVLPPAHKKKAPRVTRVPVTRIVARPAQEQQHDIPITSVASVQAILRGLGWTGHLTTKGSVIPELRDGLFGQITVDNWEQSAHKRGLDPTIVRVNGTTVHVDPNTYSALTAVAKSKGAVVGIYIP